MINERISKLRKHMMENGIDYYIVPSEDPHQSEYVADRYKSRAWISGFTGSAGTVIVTKDKAFLWTDGRYHIQAEKEVQGSEIILKKTGLNGVPAPFEWLRDNVKSGETIGFDGDTIAYKGYVDLKESIKDKQVDFRYEQDLIELIWSDRPGLPNNKAFILDTKYSGKSRLEKIDTIRDEMKKVGAQAYIVTSLDDICWTLNIRGADITYSPVLMSYLLITMDEIRLFVDREKFSREDIVKLEKDSVILSTYDECVNFLGTIKENVILYSDKYSSTSIVNSFGDKRLIPKGDIITRLKAVKNEIEIKNLIKCQEIDGVAMVRFIKWLGENKCKGINEIDVSDKLRQLRGIHELNRGESFATIAAYDDNAAMMHYKASESGKVTIMPENFLLVDSGGQYLIGTTDITRTFAMGEIDYDRKRDYTLTLKSHISLAKAIFIKGVTGPQLDILARKPMWDNGMDYKCGTGHGVGFFLNVHEGPHTIRNGINDVKLQKGMIITNEPGVYKAGKYGIRIENTILVVDAFKTGDGEFYKFDTISYCPIDTKAIIVEDLSNEEKKWLNEYHTEVRERLIPYLDSDEQEFLKELTKTI